MYSMADLQTILNKSPQSLYKLIKHNQELSTVINQNSTRKGRQRYFDEPVLQWLINYYGLENDLVKKNAVPPSFSKDVESQIPVSRAPSIEEYESKITQLNELCAELQAKLDEMTNKFNAVEAERQTLLTQQAQLLLLIQEEKKEKERALLYLPAPKRSISQRIKDLFKKNNE